MTTLFAHLFRCSAIAMIAASLTGCLSYHLLTEDSPPDLSVIKIGATRETVERELGKPEQKEHNIYTYEYNPQAAPNKLNMSKSQLLFWMAFADVASMGLTAAYGPGIQRAKDANKAEVAIVYAPNGKVLSLFRTDVPGQKQDGTGLFHAWLQSPASLDDQRLCLAANQGYAPAQFTQAMRYGYGIGTEPDDIKAYMWARLAAFGGHPSAEETARGWGRKMNTKDVEKGEALFREFGPADCPSA